MKLLSVAACIWTFQSIFRSSCHHLFTPLQLVLACNRESLGPARVLSPSQTKDPDPHLTATYICGTIHRSTSKS